MKLYPFLAALAAATSVAAIAESWLTTWTPPPASLADSWLTTWTPPPAPLPTPISEPTTFVTRTCNILIMPNGAKTCLPAQHWSPPEAIVTPEACGPEVKDKCLKKCLAEGFVPEDCECMRTWDFDGRCARPIVDLNGETVSVMPTWKFWHSDGETPTPGLPIDPSTHRPYDFLETIEANGTHESTRDKVKTAVLGVLCGLYPLTITPCVLLEERINEKKNKKAEVELTSSVSKRSVVGKLRSAGYGIVCTLFPWTIAPCVLLEQNMKADKQREEEEKLAAASSTFIAPPYTGKYSFLSRTMPKRTAMPATSNLIERRDTPLPAITSNTIVPVGPTPAVTATCSVIIQPDGSKYCQEVDTFALEVQAIKESNAEMAYNACRAKCIPNDQHIFCDEPCREESGFRGESRWNSDPPLPKWAQSVTMPYWMPKDPGEW